MSAPVRLRARALLFDMDGTLVSSTHVVERTWRRFADRHDLDVEAVLDSAHGRLARTTIAAFLTDPELVATETARVNEEERTDLDGVVAVAGAADLLAALPADRWALVTSADRPLAETRLRATGLPLPDVLVSADDVEAGKPDPAGYLRAARALGVRPEETVGFEDTPIGSQAVLAAGARLVRVGPASVAAADLGDHPRVTDLRSVEVRPDAGGTLTVTVHR